MRIKASAARRAGGGGGGVAARAAAADGDQTPGAARRRTPVTVQIDFDGMQQRIIAVPGVAERQYSELKSGAAGTVYYLEAGGRANGGGGRGGGGGGSSLMRYRLSDRRAAPFATGVAGV